MLLTKHYVAFAFILMASLLSCENTGISDFDYTTIPASYAMKGEILIDSMMSPQSITLLESRLLSVERRGKYRLKVYDTNSGQELQSILRSGRGVNEMIQPWNLSIRNDTCWIFGAMTKKMIGLSSTDTDSLLIVKELKVDEKNSTSVIASVEGGFVGTGITDSLKLLLAFDNMGMTEKAFASYPEFVQRDDSDEQENALFYGTVYKGRAVVSAKPHRIAFAYTRFNVIDIFDYDGVLLNRIDGPEKIEVQVNRASPREGMLIFDPQPKYLAYRQVKCGRKEIWASHSGLVLTRENYLETIPRKIYCFSWKGEILRELTFDIAIKDFEIDWENRKLYCLSEMDLQPCVFQFSLDAIL